MTLHDLNLSAPQLKTVDIKFKDILLSIQQYLPIIDKSDLLQFIVHNALDDTTGCFSPIRTEVYFGIAVCRWYADIKFTVEDLKEVDKIYDILETNGVIDVVIENIPEDELQFVKDLVTDTINDVARYNTSAAGIIQSMTADSSTLDTQINKILEDIKNKEGLETLDVIKNVVGKD